MIKIEIPKTILLECSGKCPGWEISSWNCQMSQPSPDGILTVPGPSCPGPGAYILVPEAEAEAMRDEILETRNQEEQACEQRDAAYRMVESLRKALKRIAAESPRNGEDCAYLIARAALEGEAKP